MSRSYEAVIRRLLPALLAAALCAGCASLAEDVATYLVEHDLKTINQDLALVEDDVAHFRKCLQKAIADGDKAAQAAIEKEQEKLVAEIEKGRKELQEQLEAGDRKGWGWVDKEAEHVKLRLRLSK